MSPIASTKELILHCTQVNEDYMKLPAGMIPDYRNLANLYRRMAGTSRECAEAWIKNRTCPEHETAVDAFWWAVWNWADAFGRSFKLETREWQKKFILPHFEFARYLRPIDNSRHSEVDRYIETIRGEPSEIILELDIRWMKQVVYFTARWNFWGYFPRESPSLVQAKKLESALRKPGSEAQKAYLESDLIFFRQLFAGFPFSDEMKMSLDNILCRVEREIAVMTAGLPDGRR